MPYWDMMRRSGVPLDTVQDMMNEAARMTANVKCTKCGSVDHSSEHCYLRVIIKDIQRRDPDLGRDWKKGMYDKLMSDQRKRSNA